MTDSINDNLIVLFGESTLGQSRPYGIYVLTALSDKNNKCQIYY